MFLEILGHHHSDLSVPQSGVHAARTLICHVGVQGDDAGSGVLGPRLNGSHQSRADAVPLRSRSDGQLLDENVEEPGARYVPVSVFRTSAASTKPTTASTTATMTARSGSRTRD